MKVKKAGSKTTKGSIEEVKKSIKKPVVAKVKKPSPVKKSLIKKDIKKEAIAKDAKVAAKTKTGPVKKQTKVVKTKSNENATSPKPKGQFLKITTKGAKNKKKKTVDIKPSVETIKKELHSTKVPKKKRGKSFEKKTNSSPNKATYSTTKGVVLIRHIPHGFYEEEMKGYFSQFGSVSRVRVVRSPRTGKSKGFGYVEFVEPEVAKIAAETMNNYLVAHHIIKTVYIPPEEQIHDLLRQNVQVVKNNDGTKSILSAKTKSIKKEMHLHNKVPTKLDYTKRVVRSLSKAERWQEKFTELGLDIDINTIFRK